MKVHTPTPTPAHRTHTDKGYGITVNIYSVIVYL